MPSHQLPQFVIHLHSWGRYAITYGYAAARAIAGALFHFQSPRETFLVALRQSRIALDRSDDFRKIGRRSRTHRAGDIEQLPTILSKPGVIWITGYSGSGKTTVARQVEKILRQRNPPTVLLDGDDLRNIFAEKWGYARSDRIDLARVYFRLCSYLSSQGFTVILAAVAMYDEVRDWIRAHIPNVVEVFLDVPVEERLRRDKLSKNVYSRLGSLAELSQAHRPTRICGFLALGRSLQKWQRPVSLDIFFSLRLLRRLIKERPTTGRISIGVLWASVAAFAVCAARC